MKSDMAPIPLDIILLTYGFLFILTFLPGYSCLLLLSNEAKSREYLIPHMLLSMALGVSIVLPFWWLISLFSFGVFEFMMVPFVLTALFLLANWINRRRLDGENRSNSVGPLGVFRSKQNAVFLIMAILAFIHFALTASYLSWPQIGDPWFHGRYILMIVDQGHLPTDFLPYDSAPLNYPLGFHLVAAGLTATMNQVPGITMILFASFVMALITMLPPYLVYRRTESSLYAFGAFLLCFFIHSVSYAQNSVYLNFLNGTYPVLVGLLMVLVCVTIAEFPSSETHYVTASRFLTISVITAGAFVTYPSFALVTGLIMLSCYSRQIASLFFYIPERLFGPEKARSTIFVILLVLSFGIMAVLLLLVGPFAYIINNLSHDRSSYMLIPSTYFDASITIPITFIAFLGAIGELKAGKYHSTSLLFAVLLIATLLSMNSLLFELGLQFLFPTRMMLVLQLWTYTYLFSFIATYGKDVVPSLTRTVYGFRIVTQRNYRTLSFILVLVAITPSLLGLVSYEIQRNSAWFTGGEQFEDDLAGAFYIKDNLDYGSLILNDQTDSDWFLPSSGIPNVVFTYPMNDSSLSRGLEFELFWQDPGNESLARSLLSKYRVEGIYLSSQIHHRRLIVWNSTLGFRPFTPAEYRAMLLDYGFLVEVFRQGNCSVFIVDLMQVSIQVTPNAYSGSAF